MIFFRIKRVDHFQKEIDKRAEAALKEWVANGRHLLEMTPQQAAEELHLSQEQLAYYFRMHKKSAFRVWRKVQRIKAACELMKERTDLPFSTVGEYVGIPDKSNFRRAFYEVCGMYPADWKKRHCR